MYKPIQIDREKLTIMGVSFPNLVLNKITSSQFVEAIKHD
jgi:hypothetical protein